MTNRSEFLTSALDAATVRATAQVWKELDRQHCLFDLSGVRFIDSTGLHAMMGFARSQNGSGPLILARPSATAKRALEIAGLEGHPGVEVS